ncbi:MAG: glycosyltransferase [Nostoc sp.]|uniref:glycosyltransferase family 2 protein n=1 Tax=Nostoc sp. TaxID=1180 RepID=UPI002FF76479
MSKKHSYPTAITPVPNEMPRPLWSVMIPTFNCANYLRQTLASVLAQDPGTEVMQIEVIDDGSTQDDPATVVEELGQSRVGFYRQKANVGYIRNFATCLQRSRGKLIHLLHGDDYVRDGFYRKLQHAFEQKPEIGAAFCRSLYIDEQGHWQSISPLELPESGILSNWLEQIAAGQRLTTPSIVVRRDVYEKLGGFNPCFSCAGEDWEMWVRIAAHYPVWFEVEPLAAYRVKRSGSLTGNSAATGELVRDMRIATEIIESYLSAYLPKRHAQKLLNKARKEYARWAIEIARQMLIVGNLSRAIAQIQEAFKCNYSLRIICSVMKFFLLEGGRCSWRYLRKGMPSRQKKT